MLEKKSIQPRLLEGKTALVTGASRGLGRAIALALGMAGAAVAVTDLLVESAEYDTKALREYSPLAGHFSQAGEVKTLKTAQEIQAMGSKICAMKLDVTDFEGVKTAVQAVEAQIGPIDILVNNAAVMDNLGKFEEQKTERWQQEQIAKGAREINRLGKELYERFAVVIDHFSKVGSGLNKAVESYNEAVRSAETRLIPSFRRFRELGVSSTKEVEGVMDEISHVAKESKNIMIE
jgi:short-subunit dehydrogenase involved in D-alanine esterification of teichoic acids